MPQRNGADTGLDDRLAIVCTEAAYELPPDPAVKEAETAAPAEAPALSNWRLEIINDFSITKTKVDRVGHGNHGHTQKKG